MAEQTEIVLITSNKRLEDGVKSARGTVIKVPNEGPGLLFIDGEQRPFVIQDIWQSPVAPAVDQQVDVVLDGAGNVAAVRLAATASPLRPAPAPSVWPATGTDRDNAARPPARAAAPSRPTRPATGNETSQIFVSYRHADSRWVARLISKQLAGHFGEGVVFRDTDTLEGGVDFPHAIEQALRSCRAFILVIGPHWLNAVDAAGRRRLEDPKDWVRLEILAALTHGVRVIPVLVEGAEPPTADQLPPELAEVGSRHAIPLADDRFDYDMQRLIHAVQSALDDVGGPPVPGPDDRRAPSSPELPVPPVVEAVPRVAPPPLPAAPRKPIQIPLLRSYMSVVLCPPAGRLALRESNRCASALAERDVPAAIEASQAARKWNTLAIPGAIPFWTLFWWLVWITFR